MRLSSKAIAACALLSFSPLCLAEVYVGGGGGMSTYKYSDTKRGFGPQVFAGYRAETVPVMFELGYFSTGKNDVEGSVDVYIPVTGQIHTVSNMSLSFSGALASIGYFGKFDDSGSAAYGKVGYYTGKSKTEGDVSGLGHGTITNNSGGALFGFGIDYMINRSFGLRFDLVSLLNVKPFPNSDEKSSITTFGIGVLFAFGGSEPAPHYQPAPVYTPAVAASYAPVAAPQQAYVPEAVPVAAAPAVAPVTAPQTPQAQFIAGSPAVVIAGGTVRGQPSTKSAINTTLPNGQAVRLDSQRIDNAEGSWWLVSGERLKGWVNDKDLQH